MTLACTTADHSSVTRKIKLNFLHYPSAQVHHGLCLTLLSVGWPVVSLLISIAMGFKWFPDVRLALVSLVQCNHFLASSWISINNLSLCVKLKHMFSSIQRLSVKLVSRPESINLRCVYMKKMTNLLYIFVHTLLNNISDHQTENITIMPSKQLAISTTNYLSSLMLFSNSQNFTCNSQGMHLLF